MKGQTQRTVTASLTAPVTVGRAAGLLLLALVSLALAPPPRTADGGSSGEDVGAGTSAPNPRASENRPFPASGFLRGMTVSCPRHGEIWASPSMTESLRELTALGVEWVAIHPYARVRRDGSLYSAPAAETRYLAGAVEIARAEGIHLFWKPHLAYWGSFEWRGDIAFGDDEAAWRRFFDGYHSFIIDQARFAEAAGVPLLAVATELEATTHREKEWREILTAVREVYSGHLTYAANWDRLDRVPFWDAVDWIGVQAYFPLSDRPDPDRAALEAGWTRHLRDLEQLSRRHGKKVLFTEIGYDRSDSAALEPWKRGASPSPAARELRRRLLEVALERLPREPWLAGMFWWKWMPGHPYAWDRGDRDFSMRAEEAREALSRHWTPRRPVTAR